MSVPGWQPLELKPIFFAERSDKGQYVPVHEYRALEKELAEAKEKLAQIRKEAGL